MRKLSNVLWGIALVAVGVLLALNAFNITDFNIFFDGWWTLFIIVPCGIGIITDSDKWGSIIGVIVGVLLLLCCQDILDFDIFWKLLIPAIIVIIGVKLILGNIFTNKSEKVLKSFSEKGVKLENGNAMFSGTNLNYFGQPFSGAELNAIFGGVKCDLRGAIITGDCVINCSAIFGGITIFAPENVVVKIRSNSIFGGSSDKRVNKTTAAPYTLYINASCIFGGVEVR